jgi:NADPH-dependent ferric siderophore reductase
LPSPRTRTLSFCVKNISECADEIIAHRAGQEHGAVGRWAAEATPGSKLGVLDPRGSQIYPADCEEYLLVADETALPATERSLEELPASTTARIVVIANGQPRELGGGREAEITWLSDVDTDSLVKTVAELPLAENLLRLRRG